MGKSVETRRKTDPQTSPGARSLAAEILEAEAQAVRHVIDHLDEDAFAEATKRLAECRGTVIVAGMGKSGIIARKTSATLASTGTPSHFLHPSEAVHGDIGRIRAEDVVLLLSYTGQTDEVLTLAALVRQDGVPVIAITRSPDSHLGRIADVCLCIGDVTEACPHNLAPTASTTAMLALGDALALVVSRQRNFSADDFAKRHPGGTLGRQMMAITDVLRLRAGDNLPLMRDSLTVSEVMAERSSGGRRVGAVLLVDADGKLTGICTDADLVKLLGRDGPSAYDRPIREVMTPQPLCLADRAVVRDAVQLVRECRLDEIPVVDADGRPVGLVDVQDLLALKVIEE